MEVFYVPVTLHKLSRGGPNDVNPGEQKRVHVGTTYFEVGTTVNDVLVFISERQRRSTGGSGLWLLQTANAAISSGGGQIDAVDGDAFTTVKDSKHRLQDNGTRYVALHFSAGADIFLM